MSTSWSRRQWLASLAGPFLTGVGSRADEASAPLTRHEVDAAARRAADWLLRMQTPTGLYVYGWLPSLNRPLPGDHLLRQAGAAAALAKAGSVWQQPQWTTSAHRAVDLLLDRQTKPDPTTGRRLPMRLPNGEHHFGFAALLLWACSEVNDSALQAPAEQLVRWLVARQRVDGAFNLGPDEDSDDDDAANFYPGEALFALMRWHARRPQALAEQCVRRAFTPYRQHWRQQPNLPFIPWQSAAWTEWSLRTPAPEITHFVFAMNDWQLRLQYRPEHAVDPAWLGGFGAEEAGQLVRIPPGAFVASCAEGLAEAWRLADHVGDATRSRRYQAGLEQALRFLLRQQYNADQLTHFQPEVAQQLDGAFHASPTDGSIRIDYIQHSLMALAGWRQQMDERTAAKRQAS